VSVAKRNQLKKLQMKQWISHKWRKLIPLRRMSPLEKVVRWALAIGIVGFLSTFVLGFLALIFFSIGLPNPSELRDLNLTESTLIMDREGNLLYAIHGDENRDSLDSLDKISPWLVDATIAIEDDQFYNHIGIDVPAIMRAVLSEVGIGRPRGGSTITQQFVKNTFLSSEHTYKRKIQEIMLSLMVELKFNKDEILLMYLNAIPYGNNAYGIQLASERYFDKDATDLTLAESALLAAIPQAPTRYSPYGDNKNSHLTVELSEEYLGNRKIASEFDLDTSEYARGLIGQTISLPDGDTFYIKGRSDLVLDRMAELNFITETEKNEALKEIQEIEFKPIKETIEAPHFALWVKQLLEEKYGSAVVEQGGLKVYTTIDPTMQKAAEEAIAEKKESNLSNYGASNEAMVSIQPQTGQILAMVGSADYWNDEIDGQVNIITSKRQPGSSFKPFVYALTFLKQYSPATVLYDVRTSFGTDTPSNYDGTFMGPISIRKALAQSRNIPAIKAYFLAGQEKEIVPFVNKFGMESITENGNYGWPLALGTAELTPLELAEGYAVFANGGTHVPVTPILKIENAEGEILEQWQENKIDREEIVDPQVAFLINDILSDPSVYLGPNERVDTIDNAAKTGTSNKKLDSGMILPNNTWLAAYTPTLVTVTWAGNANGDTMNANATGYSTAAPIWKLYMNKILDKLEPTQWVKPEGIEEVAVSKASGKLPSDQTPSDMISTEVFASFSVPTEIDDAFKTVKVESITGRLATPYSPEDVVTEKTYRIHHSILPEVWPSWESGVQAWANARDEGEKPPTEYADDIHNAKTAANPPRIAIVSPSSLSTVSDKTVDIEIDIQSYGNGLNEVTYLVNDQIQYHSTSEPYSGTIRIPTNAKEGTVLEVTAKAVDQYGYSSTSSIQLRVGSEEDEDNSSSTIEPQPDAVLNEEQ